MMLGALAALAVAALVACGGSSATPAPAAQSTTAATGAASTSAPPKAAATTAPAAAPAKAIDPCTLLTAADVSTAFGKKYEEGVVASPGQCTWNVGTSGVNRGDLVVLAVQDAKLSDLKSMFAGGTDATVKGKTAYWNPKEGLSSMWIDIGGRVLVVSFPRSRTLTAEEQGIAQKLADIAVGKM